MSFKSLKVAELREIAESFGVDIIDAKGKAGVISALEDEGVTYDLYEKMANAERADDDEIDVFYSKKEAITDPTNTILVKMDRPNPLYQTSGYTFTLEHPFVAMSEHDAQEIFDVETGFRIATPAEAREFYS